MSNSIVSEMPQFGMIWSQCVARAWQDAQFREALKHDPEATLCEAFQFSVPAGVHLQVVESDEVQEAQSANTLRMVIPPMPEMDMGEIAVNHHKPGHGRPRPFTFCFSLTGC